MITEQIFDIIRENIKTYCFEKCIYMKESDTYHNCKNDTCQVWQLLKHIVHECKKNEIKKQEKI